MRHPDEVLTRARILEHVWDFAYEGGSNVVDVYVRYLREKVDRPFGRADLETVRGVGYRLRTSGPRAVVRSVRSGSVDRRRPHLKPDASRSRPYAVRRATPAVVVAQPTGGAVRLRLGRAAPGAGRGALPRARPRAARRRWTGAWSAGRRPGPVARGEDGEVPDRDPFAQVLTLDGVVTRPGARTAPAPAGAAPPSSWPPSTRTDVVPARTWRARRDQPAPGPTDRRGRRRRCSSSARRSTATHTREKLALVLAGGQPAADRAAAGAGWVLAGPRCGRSPHDRRDRGDPGRRARPAAGRARQPRRDRAPGLDHQRPPRSGRAVGAPRARASSTTRATSCARRSRSCAASSSWRWPVRTITTRSSRRCRARSTRRLRLGRLADDLLCLARSRAGELRPTSRRSSCAPRPSGWPTRSGRTADLGRVASARRRPIQIGWSRSSSTC